MFQHIREKAKNFPVLTTSNNVHSPSSEPLILTRKRPRERYTQLCDELDDLKETEGCTFLQSTLVNQSSGSTDAELNEHSVNNYPTPKSHTTAESQGTFNLMDDTGALFTRF